MKLRTMPSRHLRAFGKNMSQHFNSKLANGLKRLIVSNGRIRCIREIWWPLPIKEIAHQPALCQLAELPLIFCSFV